MQELGVQPNIFTFPLINRAISKLQDGNKVHSLAIQMGFALDISFCNTLIETYGRSGCVDSARKVFDEMPKRNLISWTSMISWSARAEKFRDSFWLFHEMPVEDIEPNSVTIVIMFQACSASGNEFFGRLFHCHSIKKGFDRFELVINSILSMYGKLIRLEDMEILFNTMEKDLASWNIMISGYSGQGCLLKVAKLFSQMRLQVMPSLETLTMIISSFAKAGELRYGESAHAYSVKSGLSDLLLKTSLLDFYAKCGKLKESMYLFQNLPDKNNHSWSVLMSGFIQNGHCKEVIELFQRMQKADVRPSTHAIRSIILAYSHLGALKLGKAAHGYVIRKFFFGHKDYASLETAILNMYAKCGSIAYSRTCFEQMAVKDVIVWSSMIEGYGIHGYGLKALELFEQMREEGVEPNGITFLNLLSACSHSGLVNEGCIVFSRMSHEFCMKPSLNHYTCLVDLLGRSGKLREALRVIETMPILPDSRIWGALLAACHKFSDIEIGMYAAQSLFIMEPENLGYHVVVSNVHASYGRWNGAENLRSGVSDLIKTPAWSCIETKEGFHGFVSGDKSHPRSSEISSALMGLRGNMEGAACPLNS